MCVCVCPSIPSIPIMLSVSPQFICSTKFEKVFPRSVKNIRTAAILYIGGV